MKKIAIIVLCLALTLPFAGCGPKGGVYVVGEHVRPEELTEFYWTVSTTTFPPHYQRYRFFIEDGAYKFFHETREGDHLPLTGSDTTVSGTVTLTEAQWQTFLGFLNGGTVIARQEHLEDGASGPWLYLYWTGDKGDIQEFSFASAAERFGFEKFCESLRDS